MKKTAFYFLLFICFSVSSAASSFRFALFTDLHIQMNQSQPAEDLQNAVDDLNALSGIDFVIVDGDISESGDLASLQNAKKILDGIKIPYYITVGNHELKWSESGATDFSKVFGDDKFSFMHKGIRFIGFATGPIIKMGDGHIAPQDIDWVSNQLSQTGKQTPVIIATHYPLQNGDVDNWYDMTDVLRKYNVQVILNGHYHRYGILNYDQIPGIINRSTLRGKDNVGGYTIYTVSDSLKVYEKQIGKNELNRLNIKLDTRHYDAPDLQLRPDESINTNYKNVREVWKSDTHTGIYTTPAITENRLYYGDDSGFLNCLNVSDGKNIWKFKTGSRIISSPAVGKNRVVFGSTDGNIYCLDTKTGNQIWKFATSRAVMGCPLIINDTIYIGGSDGNFRALDLKSGQLIWAFDQIKSYVETRPVYSNGKIMFGAWDSYFYALNAKNGQLVWKWNNGSNRMHFSPAAVWPVVSGEKVFITAPDRYWTALDVETGKQLWRTKQYEVRETVGLSKNGKMVLSRCMNDSVIALDATSDHPSLIWKINAAFGYDHNPSMLVDNEGTIIFGTKNGLVTGLNTKNGKINWQHKIANSIVNTVQPVSKNECILTTTGGLVVRLKY